MNCTVKRGKRYRAKIEVPFLKRAFASCGVIARQLDEAGFTDVRVQEEGGGTYWAWGTWHGDDTTQDVDYIEKLDEVM